MSILSQLGLTYLKKYKPVDYFLYAVNVNKGVKDIRQNFIDKVDHFIPKSNWKKKLSKWQKANVLCQESLYFYCHSGLD